MQGISEMDTKEFIEEIAVIENGDYPQACKMLGFVISLVQDD